MLTQNELESLLTNSRVAREFFRRAARGEFIDDRYHDLYYDSDSRQILSRSGIPLARYAKNEQLILCIHDEGNAVGINMWRNLDWRGFLALCVQQCFHEEQLRSHRLDRKHDQQDLKHGLGLRL